MRYFLTLLRVAMGGLFVYAGVVKAWNPGLFAEEVRGYQLLPDVAAAALAIYLPYLEIVCGGALICGRLYAGALGLAVFMMLVFTTAIVSAWARGLDITCGCFGRSDNKTNYPWLVARDLLMLAALGLLAWHNRCTARNTVKATAERASA